ncbi:MAG: ABC transporter permease [Roseitalea porphyridii]|jgi:NitT/TauT family transport system permease protein|uniref:ABC transporter permease n=1 Tax=Roseitalea porphyridii TaxID=1852022 RepID=UPI0032EB9DE0
MKNASTLSFEGTATSKERRQPTLLPAGMFTVLWPVAGFLVILLIWQAIVVGQDLPPSVLPGPFNVLRNLWQGLAGGSLWPHIWATLSAVLIGLAIAILTGFLAGIAIGEIKLMDRFIFPVVVTVQAMPIVAIAPLLIVWFGIGLASKVWLVVISCFFPVFVQTVAGLKAAPSDLLTLYRAHGASRWVTLIDVKLPAAIDYVFAGLQIAVVLSVIACVVGEFLAATQGLGYLIKAVSFQLDVTLMFSCVILLAVLGGTASLIVKSIHGRIKFWP